MSNLFEAAAKKVGSVTAPNGKGKGKPEIDVEGLRHYAALKNAQKQIDAALETLKGDVNGAAIEYFLNAQRKDSIQGVDGDTTASLQLKKRTSRSILSDQEYSVLSDLGIDTDLATDARFYINNAYAEDTELLGKVSTALEGIVPADFLGATAPKYVVSGNAVDQALQIEDESMRETIVEMVTTQAARCKFGGTNEEALNILREVLFPKPRSTK